jgi:hypothetical protein
MVERSAGKIVLMPPGLDQDFRRVRDQPSLEVVDVPIPNPIPDQFAIRVLPRADRVIN